MVQLATFPHEELLAMFWYAPPTQCIFALDAPISNVLQTSLLTTPWKVSTTKISTEVNQSEHAKGPSMVIEPGKICRRYFKNFHRSALVKLCT